MQNNSSFNADIQFTARTDKTIAIGTLILSSTPRLKTVIDDLHMFSTPLNMSSIPCIPNLGEAKMMSNLNRRMQEQEYNLSQGSSEGDERGSVPQENIGKTKSSQGRPSEQYVLPLAMSNKSQKKPKKNIMSVIPVIHEEEEESKGDSKGNVKNHHLKHPAVNMKGSSGDVRSFV